MLLLPKWKQNITKKKTRLKAKRQKSVKQELQFQMKFNGFVFVLRCFLTPVGDCSSNVKTQDMAITAQNNRHHQYHRPSLLPSPLPSPLSLQRMCNKQKSFSGFLNSRYV